MPLTVEQAETILHQVNLGVSHIRKLDVAVAKQVCTKYALTVVPTGARGQPTKPDYIKAIWDDVSCHNGVNVVLILPCYSSILGIKPSTRRISQPTTTYFLNENDTFKQSEKPKRRTIQCRLYQRQNDWTHSKVLQYECTSEGDIDLVKLSILLGIEGNCRVSEITLIKRMPLTLS